MSVMGRLQEIFRATFQDDQIALTSETTVADIDDWDSLSHVGLIIAVETAFGLRFSATEIAELENVGALVNLIQRHIDA